MTNIIEEAEIINKFLCKIKKNMPLGIRLKKDELNDILDEIEEHIWEKAIENAGDKEPNEIDVQIAISQMGEPQDIASKFRSRTTPYVYISEELYPYYRKYRKILFYTSILSIILYVLFQPTVIYGYTFSPIGRFFSNIGTIMVIYFTFFIIQFIVFCYLSNTGYIPYRIRKFEIQKRHTNIEYIQEPKFQQSYLKIVFGLEVSFLLLSAIWLIFLHFYFFLFYLFFLLILKCLRGFIKKKSIIWQKSLILVDVFFMTSFFLIIFGFYYESISFYSWRFELPDELIYISSILCLPFFLYLWYEIYLFVTFKEKLEDYLKEVSLNKRINKKEIILRSMKKEERPKPKEKNYPLENKILSNKGRQYDSEFEKAIATYLRTAKKKLPSWLKKEEKHEAIITIEEEIRESILEFEETNISKQEALIQNINDLGILRNVLTDYKKQGTPKLYISKELWPWYLIILKLFLTYFLIISIFIIILQISFLPSFNFFLLSLIICFLGLPILILVTHFFIFLSLNDFIPENNDFTTLINNPAIQKYFYYIWEVIFTGFYLGIGMYLTYHLIFGKFSTNFPGAIYVILLSVLLLLLGGIKTLKVINPNKVKLKSALIILSVLNCLIIIFIVLYNLYTQDLIIIYFISTSKLTDSLFLPLNIEIISELLHFYFKDKKSILEYKV